MFNFFNKKKKEEELAEDVRVCKLEFSVDEEGTIWIDCLWNTDIHPIAHIMFAELIQKVCSGAMTEETLEFIRTHAEEIGRDDELDEFNQSLETFHQNHVKDMMTEEILSLTEKKKSEPVIKPTKVLGGDIRSGRL